MQILLHIEYSIKNNMILAVDRSVLSEGFNPKRQLAEHYDDEEDTYPI
jgi:hypothetical protein